MKHLRIFFIALAALMATACSQSYDADKCKALADKIQDKQELTQGDYAEMISQLNCIFDETIEKGRQINEADSAERVELAVKLRSDETLKQQVGYLIGFSIILDQAKRRGELDDANSRRYDELEKRGEELHDLNL